MQVGIIVSNRSGSERSWSVATGPLALYHSPQLPSLASGAFDCEQDPDAPWVREDRVSIVIQGGFI